MATVPRRRGYPGAAGGSDRGRSRAGIPLLIGDNGNEGATYQLMDPTAAGQAAGVLTGLFGADEAAVMLAGYATARPELDDTGIGVAVLGAERYGVPTLRLARAQAAHAPVWRYRYDGCPPGLPAGLAGGHGLDMLAVWVRTASARPRRRRRGGEGVPGYGRHVGPVQPRRVAR